jgi:hypothetical protein
MSACPQDVCECNGWPPDECPQCGTVMLGFTPGDWHRHFEQECRGLGRLYCFVQPGEVNA